MERFYRAAFAGAAFTSCLVAAAEPAAVEKQRTYALVAAIGNRFEVMHAEQQTGSHIPAWRRDAYAIGDNMLNRLALQGLDKAVASYAPDSRRIYLSTTPKRPEIELVVEELRKLDRSGWDRIMVALPASRWKDDAGLATRMRGFGLLAQPLCQSDQSIRPDRIGSCDYGFRPPSGPMAQTPKGEEIAANTFAAPFAYVEIVTLDPKSLAVLNRSANYGHRKLTDERAGLTGIIDGSNKEFLARQIVEVVQESTAEAMANGILKGSVDVQEKGPVAPGTMSTWFCRMSIAAGAIAAGAVAAAEPPRTYALVAAIGSRFEVMHAEQQTGSHIPAWRRDAYAINGNILNRLALQGLDKAVASHAPDSRRIYLSTTPKRPEIALVVDELRKMDRGGWDRIMVALPASRWKDEAGLATRMRGFGMLAQPLCQTDPASCSQRFRSLSGPTALTPKGEEIAANTFVAPFAYVEIFTLDPKTLAVLDRSANYGHRKLADETARLDGIIDGSNKEFLARQIVEVVQESTAEAMANGILKGSVDVQEKGPVR